MPLASPLTEIDWKNCSGLNLPTCYRLSHVDSDDMNLLQQVYQVMYPAIQINLGNLSESMYKFGSILINSIRFGSKLEPRGIRCSNILASWPGENGLINSQTFALSAGKVVYYFKHSLKIGEKYHTFFFACVRWYVLDEESESVGNPVKIYQATYQQGGPCSFLPVQRIHSRFGVSVFKSANSESKVAVCPIGRNVYL